VIKTLGDLDGTYTLDPAHTRIGFVARHAMVAKVRGAFNDIDGVVVIDGADPANSSVSVSIRAASIDTRNQVRDDHLRSNDFFAMADYPRITFTSTGVERTGDQTFELTGDLTIRGVTRSIAIPFEYQGSEVDPYGNERVGFEGVTRINRTDFGVNWNTALDSGGLLVSEKSRFKDFAS
jgi:polyisoprenoid-binding protein YceI